jgi:hypothetical protein
VTDSAYAGGWNGSSLVPTRNALYDKIETLQPLDATLTDIAAQTIAQGSIIYGDAADSFDVLAKDTNATRYLSNQGTSNNPSWNQVNLADGVTGDLPFANLTQIAGLSLLGVSGASTADVAAITSNADGKVLRQASGALGFGAVDLADSDAVTGTLPYANMTKVTQTWLAAMSDEATTNITTGTNKVKFVIPYAFTVTGAYCSVSTVQTAGTVLTMDINESTVSILSTKITIDNNESSSTTAATPPVISDSSIAAGAEIEMDVDTVGTAGARGLKCGIYGYPT